MYKHFTAACMPHKHHLNPIMKIPNFLLITEQMEGVV